MLKPIKSNIHAPDYRISQVSHLDILILLAHIRKLVMTSKDLKQERSTCAKSFLFVVVLGVDDLNIARCTSERTSEMLK
jgi:hypothetical protein